MTPLLAVLGALREAASLALRGVRALGGALLPGETPARRSWALILLLAGIAAGFAGGRRCGRPAPAARSAPLARSTEVERAATQSATQAEARRVVVASASEIRRVVTTREPSGATRTTTTVVVAPAERLVEADALSSVAAASTTENRSETAPSPPASPPPRLRVEVRAGDAALSGWHPDAAVAAELRVLGPLWLAASAQAGPLVRRDWRGAAPWVGVVVAWEW